MSRTNRNLERRQGFAGSYTILFSENQEIAAKNNLLLEEEQNKLTQGQFREDEIEPDPEPIDFIELKEKSGENEEFAGIVVSGGRRLNCEVRLFRRGKSRLLLGRLENPDIRPDVDVWVAEDEGGTTGTGDG